MQFMGNASSPALAPDNSPTYARAIAARNAYRDALDSDGVTEAAWRAIAVDLAAAAVDLARAGEPRYGFVEVCRSRAVDADQKADLAARMVVAAQQHSRVIDLGTLAAGSN